MSFDYTLEKISTGHTFTEGAVWRSSEKALYFTDFPKDCIYKWSQENGTELVTDKSNRAIGLTIDNDNNILVCESRNHRIAKLVESGSEAVVTQYNNKRFNSTNDVIVSKSGDIYFSDPFSKALEKPSDQGFNGVYSYNKKKDQVTVVYKDFDWPNGLCLNNDESVLYVNDTGKMQVYKFSRNMQGDYVDMKVFATLDKSLGDGAPDGMKVDKHDNLWVTGPTGIWVFDSQGNKLGILEIPEFCANFCFAKIQGQNVIFATASTSVYLLTFHHLTN